MNMLNNELFVCVNNFNVSMMHIQFESSLIDFAIKGIEYIYIRV